MAVVLAVPTSLILLSQAITSHEEVFIGTPVVAVAWVSVYLPTRHVVASVLGNAVAVSMLLALDGSGLWLVVESVLWALTLATVAAFAHGLSVTVRWSRDDAEHR